MSPQLQICLISIVGTLFIIYLLAPVALALVDVITGHLRDRRIRRQREIEARLAGRLPPLP